MKKQINYIGVGTYNKKLHTLTVEEFKEVVGNELATNWLEIKTTPASALTMKQLASSMMVNMRVENVLREKLNYKQKQMLFYFG